MERMLARLRSQLKRGSALMVAVVLTILFVGFTYAMLTMAVAHSTDALTASETLKALLSAEGGLNEAIADLNRGGTGTVRGTIGGVTFDARAVQVADRFVIDSVGTNQGWTRAIRTVVVPAVPFPVNRAAITIVGPVGEAAALETAAVGSNVLISGLSAQLPAVGVEDPAAYTRIMEDLVPKIVSGVVSENTFRGTPDVTYTAANGDTADVPILPLPTPEWDAEKLEKVRLGVIDKVMTELIPNATKIYTPASGNITTNVNLPQGITVVSGTDLKIEANFSGSGILIVDGGSIEVLNNSQFHWQGTVIVIGEENKGAYFRNNGGNVVVNGSTFILGNEGSRSDLIIDTDKGNSNTNMSGATILMSGADPNELAYLQFGDGGVNLHGFVGVFGGAARIQATNTQGVVNILGSMTVGVDGSHPDDGFAEIALDGNVHVQFNQNHLERAVAGLLQFVDSLQLPPPTYRMQGWMEISPLIAYNVNGAILNYTPETTTTTQGSTTSTSGTTTSSTTGGQGAFVVGSGKGNGTKK